MNAEVPSQQIAPEVTGKIALLRAHTTSRLPCIIPMASPARHRDRAGKSSFWRSKVGAQSTNPNTHVMNEGPVGGRSKGEQTVPVNLLTSSSELTPHPPHPNNLEQDASSLLHLDQV